MAAPLDLTALRPPLRTVLVTLPAASDITRAIQFPKWMRRLSFRYISDDGKYSTEGTDAAAINSNHQTVTAGTLHSINLAKSGLAGVDTDEPIILFATVAVNATQLRMTLEPGAA